MSAASEASTSASEVSVELDAIAKKRQKALRFYYRNRERILAAQMVQRREDPEFQERQRVKEEAVAAALAEKEAHAAEKAREKEQLRVERQVAKEAAAAAKKEADAAAKQEKRRIQQEEKNELRRVELEENTRLRQEAHRKKQEEKVRAKSLALGICLPPVKS